MNYLATNPFCPYCYVNDRLLEKSLPQMGDHDLFLTPMLLANDGDFTTTDYEFYQTSFEKETIPYAHHMGADKIEYFKKDNVGPCELVFRSYYYLRSIGQGLVFYHEVTRRFYEGDFNFSDEEQLCQVITDLGLDLDAYREALKAFQYRDLFKEYLQFTEDHQVMSVPSYIIEGQIYKGRTAIQKLSEMMK